MQSQYLAIHGVACLHTSNQGQLNAPQNGIYVEVRDVEGLLQLFLVDFGNRSFRHIC
jgi:hypothetical protein